MLSIPQALLCYDFISLSIQARICFSVPSLIISLVLAKRAQETQETRIRSLGQEDPLEEEMATHSSILAWEIPWTEEPGRLHSIASRSQTRLKQFSTHRNERSVFVTGQVEI